MPACVYGCVGLHPTSSGKRASAQETAPSYIFCRFHLAFCAASRALRRRACCCVGGGARRVQPRSDCPPARSQLCVSCRDRFRGVSRPLTLATPRAPGRCTQRCAPPYTVWVCASSVRCAPSPTPRRVSLWLTFSCGDKPGVPCRPRSVRSPTCFALRAGSAVLRPCAPATMSVRQAR